MILKHTAEALRRQDWIAVAIEFLLVVAGILIAFQISEWASERSARADRADATERLLDEAESTVAYFRGRTEMQAALSNDLDYALGHIQRNSWRSADAARMTNALLRIINASAPSPPSSVYDDLVASGAFGKIGDARLRASIANYRATLDHQARALDYLRQRVPDYESYEAFRYVFAPDARRRVRLEVDFPTLVLDSQLQESLALVAGGQLQILRAGQRTMSDAAKMCIELGRVVGRACNLHRPVPNFD
jgi:hypothetical protein